MKEFDGALGSAFSRVSKPARAAFLTALVFGLAVHIYMFAGKYPNHDEILNLFAHGDLATSGRWFLRLFAQLNTNFSMPWVNGLISIVLLACCAALTVTLLKLQSPLTAGLFAAAFIAFPSVGNTFAFMFTADAYAMVLLITAACAYLADRVKWGCAAAVPLTALCLASYQPYFCFLIGLLALMGLRALLSGEFTNREIGVKAARYACVVLGGLILYLLATKLVLWLTNVELTDYLGVNSMGRVNIRAIPGQVWSAYYQFFYFLFYQSYVYAGLWLGAVHLLLIGGAVALMVWRLVKAPLPALQKGIAAGLIALLPLLLNCAWLMGVPSVHIMMMGQISLGYALCAMAVELSPRCGKARPQRLLSALTSWGLALCLAVSAFSWGLYTNQSYLALQLKYENMYAMANRITDRIEGTEGYVPGVTPVAVLGYYRTGNYNYTKGQWLGQLDYAVGFGGPSEYDFLADDLHFHYFTRYYLGVEFAAAEDEVVRRIQADGEYAAMPCYPAAGSVRFIGDVLVVKAGGEIGDR